MDAIQTASDLYTTKFKLDNQSQSLNNDNRKLDDDIHRYISVALKSVSSASRLFQNRCIFESLINGLVSCLSNECGVLPLARAFKYLEKYFLLLVQQPWKQEYKTLKTYGGFYKTKIKSVLCNADAIFISAGYELDYDNTMVYRKNEVDKTKLLNLSFECFVASRICERIVERHNQLKAVGKTLDDAVSDILQSSWPKDIGKEKSFYINKSLFQDRPELPKREPIVNGSSSKKMPHKKVIYPTEPSPVYDANIRSQDPEQSLGNFKFKANVDPHIPFIDEAEHYPKLSQATPEEHMRESLKMVNGTRSKSDEWKYVQDALPKYSNPDSTTTYPPGRSNFLQPMPYSPVDSNLNMEFSKDEGVVSVMTIPSKPTIISSGSYPTAIPSSKAILSDHGYNTGNVFSNPLLISTGQELMSDTIHRPPDITPTPLVKNPPPRIPPRHLKPSSFKSSGRGEDFVDGRLLAKHNENRTPTAAPMSTSSQGPSLPTGAVNSYERFRSPQSLHQMKSNSLKVESKKLQSDNRVVKSMDYSCDKWQCPMCQRLNSALTPNCLSCSFSKQELKKPCLKCTFDNDWQANTCEICGENLANQF